MYGYFWENIDVSHFGEVKARFQFQGFHGQGKVREFLISRGKSLILSKSVKSQGILLSGL